MSFFESCRGAVIGRSTAQLEELANSILASLEGSAEVEALSTALSRVTTHEPKKLLLDPAEEITPQFSGGRNAEADGKLWPSVWSRVSARIAEHHLFSTASESHTALAVRLADVVEELNDDAEDDADDAQRRLRFRDAVEAVEADGELLSLWDLLSSVIPQEERVRPVMDPIQGAKRFFEQRFLSHVRHKARENGMPTEQTPDAIRMYVLQKVGKNPINYPAWMLVYTAIRCGDYRSATMFAADAAFPDGCRCESPEYYLRNMMQRPAYVACLRFPELEHACDHLMRQGARKKLSSEYRYMLMSVSFLCGHIHVADALISESAQSWDSLDEFLWFALGCVRSGNTPSVQFDYKRLRSRLSAFEEKYYTENGQRPLRYALVLFSGLQFGSALYYMLTQNLGCPYAIHVVHMAIALHHHGLLGIADVSDPKQVKTSDVVELVLHYGQSLAASSSRLAWHYYYLSQKLKRDGAFPSNLMMAESLVDLLIKSRDFSLLKPETLLKKYMDNEETQRSIFKMAAQQCLQKKEFEIAVDLFTAADCGEDGLGACNQMVAHILSHSTVLSGPAHASERDRTIRDADRVFAYIENHFQPLSGETTALKHIASIVRVYFAQEHDRVLNAVHNLPLLPKTKEETEEKVETLINGFQSVIPLLSLVFRVFCESAKLMDFQSTPPTTKNALLVKLSIYREFISLIPPPFTDNGETCKTLEVTGVELLGLFENSM